MRVFMVMPFDKTSTDNYIKLLKPLFEGEGCDIYRTDELSSHQNIIKDIVRGIYEADLIVAEITLINANVYYELGIAHGLNKPTILITQNVETLPFDLRSYRVLPYSTHWEDVDRLRTDLRVAIQAFKSGIGEFGNPVSDWLMHERNYVETRTGSEQANQNTSGLGLLGFGKLAKTGFDNLVLSCVRLADLVTNAGGKLIITSVSIGNISFTSQADIQKLEQLVRDTSINLDQLSAGIITETAAARDAWEQIRTGISGIFKTAQIRTPEDLESVMFLRKQSQQALDNIRTLLYMLKNLRNEALQSLKGMFQALDPAVVRAQEALFDLNEVFSIGEAYIMRTISLADDAVTASNK